jgi:eukaryotic-like serine/threonine-protein kinase
MSNKIGRFEIISELCSSGAVSVHKATDPENGQTVALKVLKLEGLGEQAKTLVELLQKEVESSKALQSPNIAALYSAEEADNMFFAAMEYVQGNSVATTLERKEGFSIWDLLDIARQTRQGLDYAHSKNVMHYSLEPSKIMVTWDGTVKLLSYGISQMSSLSVQAKGQPVPMLFYMSPEQLRGEPIDARSNLFSLGAIFYEMMTECKAFPGEDADQVRQQILESEPTPLYQINKKISQALSDVILKALAKDPGQRYQTGQELVEELEKCKNSPAKAAAAPATAKAAFDKKAIEQQIKEKLAASAAQPSPATTTTAKPAEPAAEKPLVNKAAAAASSASTTLRARKLNTVEPSATASVSINAATQESAKLSAAPVETEPQTPKLAVDPLMAEPSKGVAASKSFSDISELPPLKEVYVAPVAPTASAPEVEQPEIILKSKPVEKPKIQIQPREAAKKAVSEIKKTPPQLFGYSIAGAALIILIVIAGLLWHIHSENSWDESTQVQTAAPVATPQAQPAPAPAPTPQPQVQVQPVAPTPAPDAQQQNDQPDAAQDTVSVQPKYNRKRKTRAAAPVILPGQLTINSTPSGAAVSLDGERDPSWVTPLTLTGIAPGQHTISLSKAGFSSETRNIGVTQGSKSLVSVQLAQTTAGISVSSTPEGGELYVDGRDTGRATPTQISVDKPGNHALVIKKQGYMDESTTINAQVGQVVRFTPTLKALGVTDDIRYKKRFGNKSDGMGEVSIKTNPKGAQIEVNHRILDRNSPVEFYLNPGTYVIDISATGRQNLHKVIQVTEDGKVAIDETMQPE